MQLPTVRIGMCLFMILLSVSAVSAAKTFSRDGYDPPVLNATLVTGGTLDANTTYYYRAMTGYSYYPSSYMMSGLSPVINITTNSTHKSVNISINHSTGNPEYCWIWESGGVNPGTGNWSNPIYTTVTQLGTSSTSVLATSGSTKITSYLDTGVRNSYMSLGSGNYGMYLPNEQARDYVIISGGTEADPVTLEDVYQYAVNNSWPLESTIDRVNFGTYGAGDDASITYSPGYGYSRPTYIINANFMRYDNYFEMKDLKVVNFARYFVGGTDSIITIGEYDATYDVTSNGIEWLSYVHSSQSGTVGFRNAKIYDSKFLGRRLAASSANSYAQSVSVNIDGTNTAEIIDVVVAQGFDRGLSLSLTSEGNIIKRVTHYENRWETNTYSAIVGEVEDWRFIIANSGPWIRTHTSENKETAIRNVELSKGTRIMYVTPKYVGTTYYTMMNLINPIVEESKWESSLYWYVTNSLVDDTAYVKRTYTFDATIYDNDGDPLENANVTLTDNNNSVVFSVLTNVNGSTGEQLVLHTEYKSNASLTSAHYQTDARTMYQGPWDLTATYPGFMPVTMNNLEINQETNYAFRLGPVETILLEEGGTIAMVEG